MRIGRSSRRAIATGLAVPILLAGCTNGSDQEAPRPTEASTAPTNYLDPKEQLLQAGRNAASIIGCLMQHEAAGMLMDGRDVLSNDRFVSGPDISNNTPDDGPQTVILRASVNSGESLSLHASNKNGAELVNVEGALPEVAQSRWRQEALSPAVVDIGSTAMTPSVILVRTSGSPSRHATKVELGEGAPLITDDDKAGQLATSELATRVSSQILDTIEQLRLQSGIRTCDLG